MCVCVYVCVRSSLLCSCSTGGGSGSFDREPPPTNKLFVKPLSPRTDRYALEDLFPEATEIILPKDRETGERKK